MKIKRDNICKAGTCTGLAPISHDSGVFFPTCLPLQPAQRSSTFCLCTARQDFVDGQVSTEERRQWQENPKMGRCGYEEGRYKVWTGKLQINFGSKCSGSVWAEATRRWGWSISAGCEALERCSQEEGKSPALGISHNPCLETGGKLRWLFEIFLHDMRIALTLGQCYPKSGPQAGPWWDKHKHWEQTLGNFYNNLTD